VRELGKDCEEGLVVCLFYSGEEGGSETKGKAHSCGKGELLGGLQRLWVLTFVRVGDYVEKKLFST